MAHFTVFSIRRQFRNLGLYAANAANVVNSRYVMRHLMNEDKKVEYTPLNNKINPNIFDGNDIPIIMQIKYFINIIKEFKEVKLMKGWKRPYTPRKPLSELASTIRRTVQISTWIPKLHGRKRVQTAVPQGDGASGRRPFRQ